MNRDSVSTTFWGFTVAAVLWTVVVDWRAPLAESLSRSVTLPDSVGTLTLPLGVLVAWVVVLGTLVPFGAATASLRHLPATSVTVVAILEPVGAALLAWWWFGESLSVAQSVGVALVLTGIVLALRARADELMAQFERRPRIVLKESLQWDPAFDILLNRLPAHFVRHGADRDHVLTASVILERRSHTRPNANRA